MERTNKRIRWQKTGGGSFRLGNRIIKPGQKFLATEAEIPQAFRDVVIPEGGLAPVVPTPVIKISETVYRLKPRGSGGWYDVIDPNGKILNEKALKKEVAEALIEDLRK